MAPSSRFLLIILAALSPLIVGCGTTEEGPSGNDAASSRGSGGSVGSGGSGSGGTNLFGSGGNPGTGGAFVEPPPATGGASGMDAAPDASEPPPDAAPPTLAICTAGMKCQANTMCMETCPGGTDLPCMCAKGKVVCVGKCPPPPKVPPPPKPAPKCAKTVMAGGACKTGVAKCSLNAQTCTCTAKVWACQ